MWKVETEEQTWSNFIILHQHPDLLNLPARKEGLDKIKVFYKIPFKSQPWYSLWCNWFFNGSFVLLYSWFCIRLDGWFTTYYSSSQSKKRNLKTSKIAIFSSLDQISYIKVYIDSRMNINRPFFLLALYMLTF